MTQTPDLPPHHKEVHLHSAHACTSPADLQIAPGWQLMDTSRLQKILWACRRRALLPRWMRG